MKKNRGSIPSCLLCHVALMSYLSKPTLLLLINRYRAALSSKCPTAVRQTFSSWTEDTHTHTQDSILVAQSWQLMTLRLVKMCWWFGGGGGVHLQKPDAIAHDKLFHLPQLCSDNLFECFLVEPLVHKLSVYPPVAVCRSTNGTRRHGVALSLDLFLGLVEQVVLDARICEALRYDQPASKEQDESCEFLLPQPRITSQTMEKHAHLRYGANLMWIKHRENVKDELWAQHLKLGQWLSTAGLHVRQMEVYVASDAQQDQSNFINILINETNSQNPIFFFFCRFLFFGNSFVFCTLIDSLTMALRAFPSRLLLSNHPARPFTPLASLISSRLSARRGHQFFYSTKPEIVPEADHHEEDVDDQQQQDTDDMEMDPEFIEYLTKQPKLRAKETLITRQDTFKFACTGCGKCCHQLVEGILINPHDIWLMSRAPSLAFLAKHEGKSRKYLTTVEFHKYFNAAFNYGLRDFSTSEDEEFWAVGCNLVPRQGMEYEDEVCYFAYPLIEKMSARVKTKKHDFVKDLNLMSFEEFAEKDGDRNFQRYSRPPSKQSQIWFHSTIPFAITQKCHSSFQIILCYKFIY